MGRCFFRINGWVMSRIFFYCWANCRIMGRITLLERLTSGSDKKQSDPLTDTMPICFLTEKSEVSELGEVSFY